MTGEKAVPYHIGKFGVHVRTGGRFVRHASRTNFSQYLCKTAFDPKRTLGVDQHRTNEHLPVVELGSPDFASVLKLFLKAALLKIVSQPKCCA
jgi:hypothetical protein